MPHQILLQESRVRADGRQDLGSQAQKQISYHNRSRRFTAATNDIGVITLPNGKHVAIAVFVADSPADEITREATIAKIAKAVWDSVGKKV